jgi:hypothetical protein
MLPYSFPVGYTIQVVGGSGYFVIHDPGQDYLTTYLGSAVYNESNGFAIGRTLARFAQIDSGGLITGTQPTDLTTGYDALTVLTIETANTLVELYSNASSPGTQDSYCLVTLTITAPASDEWSHTFDFTTSDGGFTSYLDGSTPRSVYVASTGWENNSASGVYTQEVYIHKAGLLASTVTKIEVFATIGETAGGSSSLALGLDNASFSPIVNFLFQAPVVGTPGAIDTSGTGSQAIDTSTYVHLLIDMADSIGAGGIIVTKLIVSGTGSDPF